MTEAEAFVWASDGVMLCPVCGDENTHVDAVVFTDAARHHLAVQFEGDTPATACIITTLDVLAEPTGEDRVGIRLVGWCERCGDHRVFSFAFQQHKGRTLVNMETALLPPGEHR